MDGSGRWLRQRLGRSLGQLGAQIVIRPGVSRGGGSWERGRRLAPRRWRWICQGRVRGSGGRTDRRLRYRRRAALALSAAVRIVAELRSQRALLAVAVTGVTQAHLLQRRWRVGRAATRASHQAWASARVSKL